MKSVLMREFGGPEVLEVVESDTPTPGPQDVVIRVRAAGVNPVDWKSREGEYPGLKADQLPAIPGRDMAGEITATGAEVTEWQRGDEVFAFLGSGLGGYQDHLVMNAGALTAKPKRLSMIEAAAVPLAAMTAWQGLFDHGGLQAGQRVLILGGAGGVGHMAIQFAKAQGAVVASTAASEDIGFLRELGCDEPLAHDTGDPLSELEPVDLVLDLISGEAQEAAFAVVKPGGILVSTLGMPDSREGVRTDGFIAEPNPGQLREIAGLIDRGKVRVEVQRVLPLTEAAEAQRLQRHEHSRGKTVLEVA